MPVKPFPENDQIKFLQVTQQGTLTTQIHILATN